MKNIWSEEHILFCKRLDFQAKTKVEKGERNDKMTRVSKFKAFKSINLNAQHVNGMTHFDFALKVEKVRLLDTL